MRDIVKEVRLASDVWKKHSEGRLPEDKVLEVVAHVQDRLESLNPVLSIYGAYNAGKSTLLNALLGKEVATMGDSPETMRVTEYKWGEWTVYDTPGVDAPIEHEKATEEHLRKSECILFVVSADGDFESRGIYTRLGELVKRGKPVLLVLNDKTSLLNEGDSKREAMVYDQINRNLKIIWDEQGLNKYPIPEKIIVNAKSALKARLSAAQGVEKPLLLRKSYFPDMEEILESFLRKRGTVDVVNGLVDYFKEPFDELFQSLESELENPAEKLIERSRSTLDFEKRKLLLDVDKMLRSKLSVLTTDLSNIDVEDSLGVEQLVHDGLSEVTSELDETVLTRLTEVAETFKSDFAGSSLDLSDLNVVESVSTSTSTIGNSFSLIGTPLEGVGREDVKKTVKNLFIKKLIDEGADKAAKEGAEAAFKHGSKAVRAGAKTAKEASKSGVKNGFKLSAKKIGIIVDLGFAAYDIAMAHKKQAEYNRMQKARMEAQESMARRIRVDVRNETMQQVETVVSEFFVSLYYELNDASEKLGNEKNASNIILDELRSVRGNLASLRVE